MQTLDSAVAIIKFKPPFIRWANTCTADGNLYSKEFFADNSIAVVIPAYTFKSEARGYINTVWQDVFKYALTWWEGNEFLWPTERTRKMFGQWFEVKFVPMVLYFSHTQ